MFFVLVLSFTAWRLCIYVDRNGGGQISTHDGDQNGLALKHHMLFQHFVLCLDAAHMMHALIKHIHGILEWDKTFVDRLLHL